MTPRFLSPALISSLHFRLVGPTISSPLSLGRLINAASLLRPECNLTPLHPHSFSLPQQMAPLATNYTKILLILDFFLPLTLEHSVAKHNPKSNTPHQLHGYAPNSRRYHPFPTHLQVLLLVRTIARAILCKSINKIISCF